MADHSDRCLPETIFFPLPLTRNLTRLRLRLLPMRSPCMIFHLTLRNLLQLRDPFEHVHRIPSQSRT